MIYLRREMELWCLDLDWVGFDFCRKLNHPATHSLYHTKKCVYTLCMYIYNIHNYTYMYIHTYIHPYIHTSIHAYMHTCIHAYMHTCIHAYMHTCMHACTHTHIHTYTHTHIHTYTHTHIHTYIHMFVYNTFSNSRRDSAWGMETEHESKDSCNGRQHWCSDHSGNNCWNVGFTGVLTHS